MKLLKTASIYFLLLTGFVFQTNIFAQFDIGGDFRLRWYNDQYMQTRDNRPRVNYTRMLGRINTTYKVSDMARINVELMNLADTSTSPARGISGTGPIHFGVTQLYGEITKSDYLGLDLIRFRAGRQQFSVGNGLTFGESYYYYDKFDGTRLDLSYDPFTLTVFGAIYGQDVSSNGLWPDAPADQIYVAKLGANVLEQDLMLYGINNIQRGDYNDSYTLGAGSSGSFLGGKLDYFVEGAYQKFNQPAGAFVKEGIGYMGGLGYKMSMWPFRTIKIETKYAAFQGDDPSTTKIEQFSPPFPDFQFGERSGFVNREIGGDYPHKDKNLNGSKIWYSRIYLIPAGLTKLRLQFQYTKVGGYAKRLDGYNSYDDEWEAKIYYTLTSRIQFQLRYEKIIPNDTDKDVNLNGVISSLEDRYILGSLMFEIHLKF